MEDHRVEQLPTRSSEKAGRGWLAAAGLSAILASACCLGPLLLAAVGVSAFGVSALFAPLRPVFLLLAAVSLGAAFYRYRVRQSGCAAGGRCGSDTAEGGPPKRLWLASLVVVTVALFPVYGGAWLRVVHPAPAAAPGARGGVVRIEIEGMTCAACATGLERALAAVSGVRSAAVDWQSGIGTVHAAAVDPPAQQALLAAIERAGYRGRITSGGG